MDSIVAKYFWTEGELMTAIRWHIRHSMRPFFRVATWVMAILSILTGIAVFMEDSMIGGTLVLALGVGFILAAGPWLTWNARRQFRRSPEKNAEVEWRFSPADIQFVGPRSSTRSEWSALSKVARTPDGLLFYFVPQIFHWIPRSGFASDADFEAATQLAEKNCPQFRRIGETAVLKSFRFNVRNLLWTTFWVCVWGGAFAHLSSFIPSHRPFQGVPWWTWLIAVWFPLFLIIWTPPVAIGALFSRTRLGAIVGLALVAFVAAMALLIAL